MFKILTINLLNTFIQCNHDSLITWYNPKCKVFKSPGKLSEVNCPKGLQLEKARHKLTKLES